MSVVLFAILYKSLPFRLCRDVGTGYETADVRTR